MRRTAFGPIMPRIKPILVILLFIAAVCLETRSKASRNTSAGPSGYQLLKKLPAGGDGGWDYLTVDAGARRLYISRGTRVMVFDLDSEKLAGEIPNTNGLHGIAIASDLGRGFTSNGRDNSVTIFELKT